MLFLELNNNGLENVHIYKDIKKFLTVNKISIDIKKILSP